MQNATSIQATLSGIERSVKEVVHLTGQTAADIEPLHAALQHGKSDLDASILENAKYFQRVFSMIQQNQAEVVAHVQANATDLTPVIQQIQDGSKAVDVQTLHLAVRQQTANMDSNTAALVKAIQDNRTEFDVTPIL